ncbi:MAG: SPOR domain-containing protein, partial [Pseudomonadota bacterium]
AQTAAIWTTTVPRMLVAPDTRGAVLAGPGPAFVYAGRFSSQAAATAAADALPRSARAQVARVPSTGHFIVLLGPYANRDAARTGLDIAHDAGLEPSIIR